jgi:type I restriction enzyme S subunit
MSGRRYPLYQDTGLPWLGETPVGWRIVPLKHIVEFRSGGTPIKDRTEYWNGVVPWASSKDMKKEVLGDTEDHVTDLAISEGAASLLDRNAVIVVVRGMILAHTFPVCVNEVPMAINQDLKALITSSELLPTFMAWYLRGTADESLRRIDEAGHGTKVLRMDAWANLPVALPPTSEQTAISSFLERETAKIDALMAEQETLIELLKEKRQAVISDAVTKGLDPSVPMKDSGIDWLGEIPSTWEATALKRYWDVIDCKHVTAEFVEEGYPLASIREVQRRYVNLESAKLTTEFFYDSMVEGGRMPEAGDLIFSRNASVGEVAIVADWHPPFAMGQDVCLLRKKQPNHSSDYLYMFIRSKSCMDQLAQLMIGSTFKRVNVNEIRNLTVLMPPPGEQQAIADHLELENSKAETLTREASRAIDLLKERRSALISAAVTGKIDVRGLVDAVALEPA